MEIEAGEVDAKKGTLLRPDAPEFKPVKETTGAPAPATTAASSKRKEAEQPASAQVIICLTFFLAVHTFPCKAW